ncbi:MAG TPA: arylsulfatase, partial [Thermoanaerobaculia bacterium]|nr:arylsulfatase [Thermoanaerobaculia bacterium]
MEPRRQGAVAATIVAAVIALGALAVLPGRPAAGAEAERRGPRFPNVLLISIDTLRTDRLSAYGYRRPTSPEIDRLLLSGA